MKKIAAFVFSASFLVSCGTARHTGKVSENLISKKEESHKSIKAVSTHKNNKLAVTEKIEPSVSEITIEEPKAITTEIIEFAKTFQGTRYKFGGTTQAGMDCSGLVCVAFEKENITLPRISRDIATKGIPVSLKDIEKGDLVFFKTSRKNVISHVGLVVEANSGEVKFIHSTTQAGVIISSLDEPYWKNAFTEVRRVI